MYTQAAPRPHGSTFGACPTCQAKSTPLCHNSTTVRSSNKTHWLCNKQPWTVRMKSIQLTFRSRWRGKASRSQSICCTGFVEKVNRFTRDLQNIGTSHGSGAPVEQRALNSTIFYETIDSKDLLRRSRRLEYLQSPKKQLISKILDSYFVLVICIEWPLAIKSIDQS